MGDETRETPERWQAQKRTDLFAFAGAKALCNWPVGILLTEAEYDAAVQAFSAIKLR